MAAFKVMNDLYLRQIIFNNFRNPAPPNYEFGHEWADNLCLGATEVIYCPTEHLITYYSLCNRELLMEELKIYSKSFDRIKLRTNYLIKESIDFPNY